MSQQKIVILFFVLFAFSALFLFWQNERELNPHYQKSWWTLAFADPNTPTSLDCIIENYGQDRDFSYTVFHENSVVTEESFEMKAGDVRTLHLTLPENTPLEGTIKVRVTSQGESKEVYRRY